MQAARNEQLAITEENSRTHVLEIAKLKAEILPAETDMKTIQDVSVWE